MEVEVYGSSSHACMTRYCISILWYCISKQESHDSENMAGKYNINVSGNGQTFIGDFQKITINKGSGQPSVTRIHDDTDRDVHRINNGYALIIHNSRGFSSLESREGSEKDVDAIKRFCRKAGLTLDGLKENCTVGEIRERCTKLTEDETFFSSYDGFVCFILSHGNRSGIYGVDENIIRVKEIVSYFEENTDLRGKPKLFFIQACRGEGLVPSSPGPSGARGEGERDGASPGNEVRGLVEDDGETDYEKILLPPKSADVLVAHSTIHGEPSFRDIRTGSWFIQTLMRQFDAHAQRFHLLDIMTKVNNDMSGSELAGYRQMPIQVSTLRKSVHFKMAT